MQHDQYIPEQTEGTHKDFRSEVRFDTAEDAEELFLKAKQRLLHVNNWHQITDSIRTVFQIRDRYGKGLLRPVRKNDLITIDIPGPEHTSGTGQDWVHVEELAYDDFPDQNRELLIMTLRPTSDPIKSEISTSHFFTKHSTSSFVIERVHNKVVAHYYGRNEKPNTKGDSIADAVRNTIVAIGALAGFSDIQWKGLLNGFLS